MCIVGIKRSLEFYSFLYTLASDCLKNSNRNYSHKVFDQLIVFDFEDFRVCFWHEFEIEFEEPEAVFRVGDFVFLGHFDVFSPLIIHHQGRFDSKDYD